MTNIIVSHESPEYIKRREALKVGKNNGAYWYSKEIVKNIIPKIKTKRPWVTLNVPHHCADHAIVFIHANRNCRIKLSWLAKYKDLILIVSSHSTERWCKQNLPESKTIFLPLSVDVEEVKKYRKPYKTGHTAYAGNPWYFQSENMNRRVKPGTPKLSDLERDKLLNRMADYKYIYAVGRTAIEAKILGCKILPFDARYPDPAFWRILDNADAAKMLQAKLDEIDGAEK